MSDAQTEKTASILLTPARLSLVLSVIALLSVGHQISRFALDLQNRTTRLEEKYVQSEQTQVELGAKIDRLSTVLGELTITLREVQIRQEPK